MAYSHPQSRRRTIEPAATTAAFAIMILLKGADVATTIIVVESGVGVEANPLSRFAIDALGLVPGLALKALIAIGLAFAVFELLARLSRLFYLRVIGFLVVAAVFALGAFQNLTLLLTGSDLFVVPGVSF